MNTALHADVVIVGGGMAGATLALALDQAGITPVVIDSTPLDTRLAPEFDGRAFAIAYACMRHWHKLGVGEALAAHAQPIEDILVTDGRMTATGVRPGPWHLRFLAAETTDHGDGTDTEALGYMLEARHIRAVLSQALVDRGIETLAPVHPAHLETKPQGVTVTLDDGRTVSAQLIVGADGARSWVRQAAEIETSGWDYHQDALVLTVGFERPHKGVAHEVFLPGGPFAILPLTGGRANIVWTEPRKTATGLMALPHAAFVAAFARRFGDHLGKVELLTPVWRYPLRLQRALHATAPRLALVGDAAHVIHPLAGQGLNLGLKDVAALAETLAEAQHIGEGLGAETTLARYARSRHFDEAAMAYGMDGFKHLFSNDIAPVRLARGLGLAAVDALPPLRTLFSRIAGADVGDVPKGLKR